ncbi:MAG: class I SAM-dependent methyltransferase [Patescibacteria group bacterium]|jgi:trans-aconitate methyltransferase
MKTWYNFYKDRLNGKYFNHVSNKYNVFINEILNSINYNHYKFIVEVGCGICSITRALMEQKTNCIYFGLDKSKEMLNLSLQNLLLAQKESIFELIQCNILSENCYGDLVHSHGVLEHFSDKHIQKIINNQLKNFRELIHYVPSNKYKNPSFGNERLLTSAQWKKICNPNEIIEFNDGYDLILKWKK